ncbi:MAG: FxLYD domain-containing protein [Bacillota bacterium]|nr:FxLYD domain-containing protein [Bacillota bacterium]
MYRPPEPEVRVSRASCFWVLGFIVVLIVGANYFFNMTKAPKPPEAAVSPKATVTPPAGTTEPPSKDDPTSSTTPPTTSPPATKTAAPPALQGPSQSVLRVTDLRFVVENNIRFAAGTATNVSSKTLKYMEIEVGLLSRDGQQVGSVMVNTARETKTFPPGSTWKFRATVLDNRATSLSVKTATGF